MLSAHNIRKELKKETQQLRQQQQQQQQQTNSIIDKLRECKIHKLWFTNLNKIFKKLSLQS